MADKITTLHPENDTSINLYPNVKDENIPSTIARVSYVDAGDNENDLAISAVRADLDTEIADRKKDTADTNGRIDGLATDISILETRITGVNDELTEEIANRKNADTALKDNILDIYRMVIRSGGTITVTDASVALSSQPFPLTVSPKALLDYVGGMCKKCENLYKPSSVITGGSNISAVVNSDGSITISGSGGGYIEGVSGLKGQYYSIRIESTAIANGVSIMYGVGGTGWGSIAIEEKTIERTINFYDNKDNFFNIRVNDGALADIGSITIKIMLVSGTIAKTYEAYYEGIKTAPVTKVTSKSANGSAVEEYPIPVEVQALDGYGWGINAECNNFIDLERKKFVKKVAKVDLGTLTWNHETISTNTFRASIPLLKVAPSGDSAFIPNLLCQKYDVHPFADFVSTKDDPNFKAIGQRYDSNTIVIADRDYTNETEFKQAMSGVYLYYELATPVETDISQYLDRDLPDNDVIEVSAGGCLEFENENDIGVPYSVTYQSKPETQGE